MKDKTKPNFFERLLLKLAIKKLSNMKFTWLDAILARFLDKFKTKPKVWAAIVSVATVLQFGIDAVGTLSLDWIITKFGLNLPELLISVITWVIVAITSPKTTAFLPTQAREKRIAQSKEIAADNPT